QAEDGIRDLTVTGVQTCALPISVEIRLYDTRPIWEKVQAEIAQLHEGQQRLEEKIEALRNETRTGSHDIKRQLSVLNDTLLQARADYKDLDKRVYQLEESRP